MTPDDMLTEALGDKVGEMETRLTDGLDLAIAQAQACHAFVTKLRDNPKTAQDPVSILVAGIMSKQADQWVKCAENFQAMLELMGAKA